MECRKRNNPVRLPASNIETRPQPVLEMIQTVASWLGASRLRMLGDSEYTGGSMSHHLPVNAEWISLMTMLAIEHP
jgi:hypothetical protein